ncbi:MAG TPA: hypothetical protein VLD18_09685, partial [Verrucomicrobiae bacterium]|nr:hypothetical protein [Verrucomicrobiae bacterium]
RQKDIADARAEVASHQKEIAPREEELDRRQQEAVAKAEAELKAHQDNLPAALAAWEKSNTLKTRWTALSPKVLAASNGATLDREGDLSVFASGKNGRGIYTVEADSSLDRITAVKLELLADARLPKNGPGRAGDGNFVLTELELAWLSSPSAGAENVVHDWTFQENTSDWKALHECELSVEDGALKVARGGNDPFFGRDVSTAAGPLALELTLRSEKALQTQLFWKTKDAPEFNEQRVVTLAMAATGGGWATHRIYFKPEAELAGLRIDPGSEKGDIFVKSIRLLQGEAPQPVKLALQNAQADFSQEGFDVKTAIDGKTPDDNNGWASHPKLGVNRTATFELKKPVQRGAGGSLRFALNQNYKGNEFSLGRFRLWATASEGPVDFGLPDAIGGILEIAADQRTEEQRRVLLDYFRAADPELKKKEQTLAEAKKPRPIDPRLKELQDKLARVEQPLPPDPKLADLERAVKLSTDQLQKARLTGAQDLAWALINNPAFLFNH